MEKVTIKNYLDDLASGKPTPGGGSAAALAGAVGAGLLSMVANFTVGKEKYKDVEEEVNSCLQTSEKVRGRLLDLVKEDTLVYAKVSAAYKLPKGTAEEKDKRAQAIQEALKGAASVPIEICQVVHQAVEICPQLLDKGNPNLVSDVGVGVVLLASAFESALINVEINLNSIKDEDFVINISKVLEPLKKEIRITKETVWQKTSQKIGSL